MATVLRTRDFRSSTPAAPEPAAVRGGRRSPRIVGLSAASQRIESLIRRAAATGSTVLISGETGCGKEEVARALHAAGSHAAGPFVAMNCGAMAASLIESQLFGHNRGAFTGAHGTTQGAFRAADGGVIFLDEIGEMPLDLQPRLLRVLQEREVTPIGSCEHHPVNVQVIAATNRDLRAAVAGGTFREDLFYRLNTIEIDVPPLRDRVDDIPLFLGQFSQRFAARFDMPAWEPDAATLRRFTAYHWPGNVRQLAQTVERFYALGCVPPLPDELRPPPLLKPSTGDDDMTDAELPVLNLEALRRLAVRQALARSKGHKGHAAALLGVHLNTMTRLVENAGVDSHARRRGRPRRAR